jgi:NTE family protein
MAPPSNLIRGEALSLSGGGFRSTLFQVGAILRLNQLGLLQNLKCISSVSGGSIASGFLAAVWGELRFESSVAANLDDKFAVPLRSFCNQSIDEKSIAAGLFSPFESAADELVKALDDGLFKGKTLQDLPNSTTPGNPRFVFNATSMHTGARFWFSREDIGDWRIGSARKPTVSLARVVAASSAFPPFFAPVSIDVSELTFESCLREGSNISDLLNDPTFHATVACADGGTYDNMALGAVWDSYDTLWVSDASAPLDPHEAIHHDWLRIMLRIVDVMMRSSEARRRQDLMALFRKPPGGTPDRYGAYWSTSTDIAHLGTPNALTCDRTKTEKLASLGTRLAACSNEYQDQLINWGYALADAAARKSRAMPGATPPQWPCPNHPM